MLYSCAEFTAHRYHIASVGNYFELASPLPCDVPVYYAFDYFEISKKVPVYVNKIIRWGGGNIWNSGAS